MGNGVFTPFPINKQCALCRGSNSSSRISVKTFENTVQYTTEPRVVAPPRKFKSLNLLRITIDTIE